MRGSRPSKTERMCFVQKDQGVLIRPAEAVLRGPGEVFKAGAYNLQLEE